MKILLVEDNLDLSEKIAEYLELEDIIIHANTTGKNVLHMLGQTHYDCILLDVSLPEKNGFEICEEIRREGIDTPIIFLTAFGDTHSRVHGLNLGADDYITKPFQMEELLARIQAHNRRYVSDVVPEITYGDLHVDLKGRKVTYQDTLVDLTPKEYDVLHYLLSKLGTVISQGEILENVWGENEDLMFSRTVDVHISQLRKKLDKKLIETVPSRGYVIRPLES